ncbi:conidial development fluffy [Apiospora marii]|uniref:conidial development fluffy n=1 Tax=Apiospora marii TaxID=335849 RepID=UPI00312DD7D5
MSKRYRTLIPAPVQDEGHERPPPEPERPPPEKKQKSHMACGNCRIKKSKCDGKRPTCNRCTKQQVDCLYAEEDKALTIAGLQSQVQKLERDLDLHTDFIAHLQAVPSQEANDILRRLRTSPDASQVLASVRGRLADQARPSDLRHARGLMPPTGSSIEAELTFLHGMVYPAFEPIDPANIDIDTLLRSATRSSHRHHGPAAEALTTTTTTTTPTTDADGWKGQSALSSPWEGPPYTTVFPVSGPSEDPEYCDERLKDLNIGYWTRVPLDNAFAASAISLYLESEHPFFGAFDADLVIDDLVYQRVDFCSPLLAVSLLYMACLCRFPGLQQSFTTVDIRSSTLVPALFHEAQKLYKADAADNRPVTIAAIMLFGFASTMAGQEPLALDLFACARRKAVETGLFGVPRPQHVDEQWEAWRLVSSDQLRERAQVAWGAFNWLTIHAIFYALKPIEHPPPFPIPGDADKNAPNPRPPFWPPHQLPDYMGQTFSALSRFCILTQEMYLVYYCNDGDPDGSPPSLAFAESKFQALLSWADTLPEELACGDDSPAHTYLLFCLFHGTVLYLFRPFLHSAGPTPRLRSFAAADGTLDRIFDASVRQLKRLLYIYVSQLQSTLYSPILSCGLMHLNSALMKTRPRPATANPDDPDKGGKSREAEVEWRFYFRLSLSYLQELYKRYPMWIDVIKANLAMAVDGGNLTSAEALQIIDDIAR